MRAADSIYAKLRPLGLYSLTGDTLVDAELKAYEAGLDLIYEALELLERENFIATARDEGLVLRELAFGPRRDDLPVETRRSMLFYRGAVTVNDFDRESIVRAMRAVGLDVAVTEDVPGKRLYINCLNVLDANKSKERLAEEAALFLPAHLEAEFDFGYLTWDYIDETERSFDGWDALDYAWDALDTLA